MTAEKISVATEWQGNRAGLFQKLIRGRVQVEDMLRRHDWKPIDFVWLPSEANEYQKVELNMNLLRGLERIKFSLYMDLIEDGAKDVANRIMEINNETLK